MTKKPRYLEAGTHWVCLEVGIISTMCAKEFYCFKQREDAGYSRPDIDLAGSNNNGNNNISFNCNKYLLAWRFATAAEIAEYERLGMPYDVRTLPQNNEQLIFKIL
jgi:hypothetical protein